ncbi:Hypothetical predicted protein [Scomber scombrus]|uniref:Uncharacterized protein n=1 Tax=Scomber scombrus TaxID=13677 RepID=A0AAV1PQI0_SCOSC
MTLLLLTPSTVCRPQCAGLFLIYCTAKLLPSGKAVCNDNVDIYTVCASKCPIRSPVARGPRIKDLFKNARQWLVSYNSTVTVQLLKGDSTPAQLTH